MEYLMASNVTPRLIREGKSREITINKAYTTKKKRENGGECGDSGNNIGCPDLGYAVSLCQNWQTVKQRVDNDQLVKAVGN